MKIVGIYFSGTGNTKWVAKQFQEKLTAKKHHAKMISIEDYTVSEVVKLFEEADLIGFFYPIYGSDMPEIFEKYIEELSKFKMSKRKHSFCITSVAIYSGDGALMVKKYCDKMNLELAWGYNVHMACNFDTPIPGFQIPSEDKIRKIKVKADAKLNRIVENIEQGIKKLEGSDILNTIVGSFQRKSNKGMMHKYDIKINKDACIKCGKCVRLCPTKNLALPGNGDAVETHGNCTVCLRCINNCPTYAIRIMNPRKDKPYRQYKGPNKY
ncbi:EFR1 family ferrodoxin [Wukongibacter baidiensis]|uniref:EFR1 family ferrodoxin n=1 Tax=Wukongibacter baidiensis TaxID=1723361 RepID=UPI003D7FC533